MNVHTKGEHRAPYGFFSSLLECSFTRWMEWVSASIARYHVCGLCSYFVFDAPKTEENKSPFSAHALCMLWQLTCEAAATALKTSCFVDNEPPLNDVIIRNALKIIVFHAAARVLMLSVGQWDLFSHFFAFVELLLMRDKWSRKCEAVREHGRVDIYCQQ